jgi:hypothetical protein
VQDGIETPSAGFIHLVQALAMLLASLCTQHLLLLLVFPQAMFDHRVTYKGFTVHRRSEIPPEVTRTLDRVEALLARSELFDPDEHHEIFLVDSYELPRILFFRNVHFGCNLPTGDTFITHADVTNDVARCERISPDDERVRTLSESIAHEITHDLIRKHLGWWNERRVPSWIKEGYCEHVARGSAIDTRTALAILTTGSYPVPPGLPNLKHRWMIEYLLHSRFVSIDDILRAPPDYRQVESEVLARLRADGHAFLRRIGSATDGTRDR